MNKNIINILFECANILLALVVGRAGMIFLKLNNEIGDLGFVMGVIGVYILINIGNKLFSNKYNHAYLGLTLVAFLQVYFLNYSIIHLGLYLSFSYLSLLIFTKCRFDQFTYIKFINALFLSIPLFFITKYFSYSIFGFGWFFVVLLLAHVENKFIHKLFSGEFFWILAFSVFVTGQVFVLIGLVILACFTALKLKISNKLYLKYLYISFLVFVFNYNPLYSMGILDTVEEGFWLGWWQRIIQGGVQYKDFWMYHPPLLLNLLKIWGDVFGIGVDSFRGYIEFLRIVGLIVINLIIAYKIKNNLIRGVGMVVVSVVCFGLVKNNIEIRSAFALLGILLGSIYLQKGNKLVGVLTGVVLGFSLAISIETGIAAVLGIGVMIVASGFKKVKLAFLIFCGMLLGILSWLIGLIKSGLGNFIDLIGDYVRQFSAGYLGLNIDFPKTQNILNLESIINFVYSNSVWWLVIIGLFVWIGRYVLRNRSDMWLVGMFGYCVFMIRVALGRSDWQHLVFLVLPVLMMSLYLIWKNDSKFEKKYFFVFLIVVFIFGKQQLVEFGNSLLQRWQSYGIFPGSTVIVNENRWRGSVSGNSDVGEILEVTNYIENNYPDSYIFSFPWRPELYFLSDSINATKSDVPIAYIDSERQKQIIDDLNQKRFKTVIYYEKSRNIGGVGVEELNLIDEYILSNFKEVGEFKNGKVMVYFEGGKDK